MSFRAGLLWVTDPWETLDHPRDTTLRLMEECVALGAPCFWADVTTIAWGEHGAVLDVFEAKTRELCCKPASGAMVARGQLRPSDFGLVMYRPDPPVDLAYLHPLQLIAADVEQADASGASLATQLVNPAHVLLSRSEKMEGAFATGLMPPSVVASSWSAFEGFGRVHGRTVAKPLHDAQSKGVHLLDWRRSSEHARCREILGVLTQDFRRPVMLQRYLEEVMEGETRLWFVDGELLAAARKKPAQGTFRIDMDKGGKLQRHVPTREENEVAGRVGAHLMRRGIRLAAVDLIAGWVTDFNFTSPGLLPAMEALEGRNLAREVVRALMGGTRRPVLASGQATGLGEDRLC